MVPGISKIDHSRYGAFGVRLAFGRKPNNEIVHISTVEKGLACDCVCPACGEPVVAHKGEQKADHFVHHRPSGACSTGPETNAHIWAKLVLDRTKTIFLPAIEAVAGDRKRTAFRGRTFAFKDAILEPWMGDIVPDVLLRGETRQLIVEVLVTHACDDAKIEKIRARGISAIEVDLSSYRTAKSEAEIEQALLRRAPRKWLFNPFKDKADEDLRDDIAKERQAQALAAQDAASKLAKAARAAKRIAPDNLIRESAYLDEIGLDRFLKGPVLSGDGFIVPPALWQAAILGRLTFARPTRHGGCEPIDALFVLSLIQDCIAPVLRNRLGSTSFSDMSVASPPFVPPTETIDAYLTYLREAAVLIETKNGLLVSNSFRTDAEAAVARRKGTVARQNEAKAIVDALLISAKVEDEGPTFSRSAWEAAVPGCDGGIADLVKPARKDWEHFRERASRLQTMLDGGRPCDDLMGFPFEAHLAIAEQQAQAIADQEAFAKAEVLKQAATKRCERAKAAAVDVLGERADIWLSTPAANSPLTPQAAAERDDQGLRQVLDALSRVQEKQRREAALQAEAEVCRAALKTAAERMFDGARLNVFLNASHPETGGISPLAYCTDRRSLDVCLGVVTRAGKRR